MSTKSMCQAKTKNEKPCPWKAKPGCNGFCKVHKANVPIREQQIDTESFLNQAQEENESEEPPIALIEPKEPPPAKSCDKLTSKVLYSKGGNDECYTQDVAVYPILKFIPKDAVIWCPFDKPELSEFVKQISKTNKVISSHIDSGQDFLKWEPKEHWDMIVSNPPFTNKRVFFQRALSFNKPFALIMTNTWLNDSAPTQLFQEKELQLLMFDRRMKFNLANGKPNDKITFSSSYYCWNVLPKQIVMDVLPKQQLPTKTSN